MIFSFVRQCCFIEDLELSTTVWAHLLGSGVPRLASLLYMVCLFALGDVTCVYGRAVAAWGVVVVLEPIIILHKVSMA